MTNPITKTVTKAKFTVIKQHICDNIESGQWQQHSKVPSENELALEFNVSRMTARRALQELTEQGLLVRTQGAGTFVATFKSQSSLLEIRNIADEIHERNNIHHCEILNLEELKLNQHSNSLLKTEFGSNFLNSNEQGMFFSRIIHFENDRLRLLMSSMAFLTKLIGLPIAVR